MKKLLLAALLVAGTAATASAQVEIGLKLSPSVTSLRTESPSALGFRNESSKLTIGGGVIVDYFFGQNYAFSSGLLLTGKGGKISYFDPATGLRQEQKIGLQYLEVPVTVKLFTNDVATDTKLYFQLGGSVNAAIAGKINGGKRFVDPGKNNLETKASDHVIIPDASVMLGTGVEYQVGQSTKVFAGISYYRGLLNIEKYFEDERDFADVSLKNSEFRLDLGLKF